MRRTSKALLNAPHSPVNSIAGAIPIIYVRENIHVYVCAPVWREDRKCARGLVCCGHLWERCMGRGRSPHIFLCSVLCVTDTSPWVFISCCIETWLWANHKLLEAQLQSKNDGDEDDEDDRIVMVTTPYLLLFYIPKHLVNLHHRT